ncbi:MAG: dienelactone hydrolase family protein, partial [Dehalococcoidia bacterium]|nr:dienelactone hydrolase family protein [Dehalococcoidia bacterium]
MGGAEVNGKMVRFLCGDLSLEGVLHIPRRKPVMGGVVVCHPHPLYGGDMDNNVVRAICQGLEEVGLGSLRFNFRGVGESEGSFANGVGELADVEAAVSLLSGIEAIDTKHIGLCGYSFGAGVAFSHACRDRRVRAIAAVSIQATSVDATADYAGPKLLVCGSRDLLTPAHEAGSLA